MADSFDVWFLSGKRSMNKVIGPTPAASQSYPLLKAMTSHTHEFAKTHNGVQQFGDTLLEQALKGHCLIQGPLTRPIENESRAGMADKLARHSRVVFDLDAVLLPNIRFLPPLSRDNLEEAAEAFIRFLPKPFHHASYVAMASSSAGMKSGRTSMHLHFFLQYDIDASSLTNFLKYVNLTTKSLQDQMDLTASGTALRWPVDVCTAQNTRIIYIAPPRFEDTNSPFVQTSDRFVTVIKDIPAIDLLEMTPADHEVAELERKMLKRLRLSRGLPAKSAKTTRVREGENDIFVVTNPDEVQLHFAYERDDWIYYNINGGDSNAYWTYRYNPSVIHNFKGEPPFSFQAADPVTFAWHCNEFLGKDQAAAGKAPALPVVGIDYSTDTGFKVLVDPATNTFVQPPAPCQKANMKDFMEDHAGVMPAPVPTWDVTFDPTKDFQIDIPGRILNQYTMTEYIARPVEIPPRATGLTVGKAHNVLADFVPTIHRILWSVTGCDHQSYERFLNWLAYIVQTREKAQTAWLFHGVHGTGKGVFFNSVLRPMFGQAHAWLIKLRDLENNSNAWIERSILVAVDEFNVWSSSNPRSLENELKNLITEPEFALRGLYKDHRTVKNYANMIFFSNEYDILHLDSTDRRYNIAPRQEMALNRRYTDIEHAIQAELPGEIARFTAMLLAYDVDVSAVKRSIDNEAKNLMRLASRTNEEDFFSAVKEGDFPFFHPLLELRFSSASMDYLLPAQTVLKRVLRDHEHGKEQFLTTSELCSMYQAVFSKRDFAAQLFGKKLSRWGIQTSVGKKAQARGISIRWDFGSLDVDYLRARFLHDFEKEAGQEFTPQEEASDA